MPASSASVRRRSPYAAVAGVGVGAALGWIGAASYFARRVLTPERARPDDTEVLAVAVDEVTLAASVDTLAPGRYGLWFRGGHARIGEILATDEGAGTVRRRLDGVAGGPLVPGGGRWTGSYYVAPTDETLGAAAVPVEVPGELGTLPAWRFDPTSPTGRWAVLVHGRGATRDEPLRAVRVLLDLGITVLVPSYRNDPEAPPAPDGRYSLGLSEWRDVEAAMVYAVGAGADSLVLGGWSMGGATVLQTLARSWLADLVDAVVLDAPVVDWGDVLAHQARLHRVPPLLRDASALVMGRRSTRRLVGVHEPVDVAQTDWVSRAAELRHPMLIVHSRDDDFVPVGPSERLAAVRPDLVRFEPWTIAGHCKEWNTEPARWERVVGGFLRETLGPRGGVSRAATGR